jgi:hypothetical protein
MAKNKTTPALSPEKYIRTKARSLPLGICYIGENWRQSGFTMTIVTRMHSNKNITFGVFMVDLFCLGVKDAFWRFNQHPLDFKAFLEKHARLNDGGPTLVEAGYPLIHNIIYGAMEYAGDLGFFPHKDFDLAQHILEEDDERIDLIDIEFGYKGRPLYVSTSKNPAEANKTMAQLEKQVGRGNFNFVLEPGLDDFFEKEDKQMEREIDFHNPEFKRKIITNVLYIDPKSISNKDELLDRTDQIFSDLEKIYYNYILSNEDFQLADDTIQAAFDFDITDEEFSDEMLFGNIPSVYPPAKIRAEAEKINAFDTVDKGEKWQKAIKTALKEYPGIPIFQYYHLRLLQAKKDFEEFRVQLLEYLEKNPDYFPFVCLKTLDFFYNRQEDDPKIILKPIYLKDFFPGRTSFCAAEVFLCMQALAIVFMSLNQFAHLDLMYDHMDENYPDFFDPDKIRVMQGMKIPFVFDWCREWVKNNGIRAD